MQCVIDGGGELGQHKVHGQREERWEKCVLSFEWELI